MTPADHAFVSAATCLVLMVWQDEDERRMLIDCAQEARAGMMTPPQALCPVIEAFAAFVAAVPGSREAAESRRDLGERLREFHRVRLGRALEAMRAGQGKA
ncbi:hypothetical protein OEW28_18715 [Defluviimonas sp. WL0002]|uniref:Uncharacterized protein n=1 Tax=Albidovulum marisflavi TaxID=2984159 RepID=A0ABT2ZHP5_9RHOB|nr:hypothetical protein [Defluviimonas sp. WL0002]MCV2870650.1 hypothetical protein [Defluviimonas sp. WL0002]